MSASELQELSPIGRGAGCPDDQVNCQPAPAGPLARERILVVENDDDTRAMVTAILSADGHPVAAAKSGPEALGWLSLRCFDLIICGLGHSS